MKTYKSLATIETISAAMEAKQFWSIIAHCRNQPTFNLRDYDLLTSLAKLPISEIVGFALRVENLASELLQNEDWKRRYEEELQEYDHFTIEDIALWAIFQGQEFYEASIQTPMFLIKRTNTFKAEEIPENTVVTHALGLKIAEEYIRFEDFVSSEIKEKMIW